MQVLYYASKDLKVHIVRLSWCVIILGLDSVCWLKAVSFFSGNRLLWESVTMLSVCACSNLSCLSVGELTRTWETRAVWGWAVCSYFFQWLGASTQLLACPTGPSTYAQCWGWGRGCVLLSVLLLLNLLHVDYQCRSTISLLLTA